MKQIKDMNGICKFCDGYCLRVELEDFKSVYRCKDFVPTEDNWQEKIRKELEEICNLK